MSEREPDTSQNSGRQRAPPVGQGPIDVAAEHELFLKGHGYGDHQEHEQRLPRVVVGCEAISGILPVVL